MATRADLRASLRARLEDGAGNAPLFADGDLNDLLGRAIELYGRWVPKTATASAAGVVAGVTSVALPAAIGEATVVAVRDGAGAEVRVMATRTSPRPASSFVYHEQAFRVWGGALKLQRPVAAAEAGTWEVDYLAPRSVPTDETGAVDVAAGDEPLLLELALAAAYERRAFEGLKRGETTSGLLSLAGDARSRAAKMVAERNRRAVGGWLDVA